MLKDIAPKSHSGTVVSARRLRREMTLPEALVWRELRGRPCGLKFRRQHAAGPYVFDFYCSDARVAIEIDSFAHDTAGRPERDRARDAWFARSGIATLRIPATDVLRDLHTALESIVAAARNRLPLHHPAAPGGPPPRDKLGGGLSKPKSSPSSLGEVPRRGGGAEPLPHSRHSRPSGPPVITTTTSPPVA